MPPFDELKGPTPRRFREDRAGSMKQFLSSLRKLFEAKSGTLLGCFANIHIVHVYLRSLHINLSHVRSQRAPHFLTLVLTSIPKALPHTSLGRSRGTGGFAVFMSIRHQLRMDAEYIFCVSTITIIMDSEYDDLACVYLEDPW